jgi:hypothetical protein
MTNDAPIFLSCPIAARFIATRDDACAYYAYRMVGERRIEVDGVTLRVRFNAEETHLFTDTRHPCPPGDCVRRAGASGEVRCFSLARARMLDAILPTLERPAVVLRAKIPGGVMVFGPADASAWRMSVVVAPARDGDLFFVRTAFSVSPKDFAAAVRAQQRAPWPPK